MTNSWLIDARYYDPSTDVARSTLFRSDVISDFLESPQSNGAVVTAPKGGGKTLLLKHKRWQMESQEEYICLPTNQMVEAIPGPAANFSNEDLEAIKAQPDFWSQLWQISISIAVADAVGAGQKLAPLAEIDPMLTSEYLKAPFEIFEHLLQTRIKDFKALCEAYRIYVRPVYRNHHGRRIAVFIDNIDEFFSPHLERTSRHEAEENVRDRFYGQLSRPFWDSAQVGFLLAVHALKALNPHIKLYGAIRSEALNSYSGLVPDLANARALLVKLNYSPDNLRTIFEKNIQAEKSSRLATGQHQPDAFVRLVGKENIIIRHSITGLPEHIFDYCLRHTLARPRDLMRMGAVISNLAPEARSPTRLREVVNDESAEICSDYLGEVRPQFLWFDEDALFKQLHCSVLTPAELRALARRYYKLSNEPLPADADEMLAPFADLFNAGLLGIAEQQENRSTLFQRFMQIKDIGSAQHIEQRNLPEAARYLIHPVLGSYIRKNYPNGLNKTDSVNIVSPGAEWRRDTDMHFVLIGDVEKASARFGDKVAEQEFRSTLRELYAMQLRPDIDYPEHRGGDNFLFIDRSLHLVLQKARILEHVLSERFGMHVRFGLDYGNVRFETDYDEREHPIAGGLIPRASRLCAAAPPGSILMLEHAQKEFARYRFPFAAREGTDADGIEAVRTAGLWDIGKGHEDLNVAAVYVLNALDAASA